MKKIEPTRSATITEHKSAAFWTVVDDMGKTHLLLNDQFQESVDRRLGSRIKIERRFGTTTDQPDLWYAVGNVSTNDELTNLAKDDLTNLAKELVEAAVVQARVDYNHLVKPIIHDMPPDSSFDDIYNTLMVRVPEFLTIYESDENRAFELVSKTAVELENLS